MSIIHEFTENSIKKPDIQNIKLQLEIFENAKFEANTIDEIIAILHKEEQYLKSLKEYIPHAEAYSKNLIDSITIAVENDREHIIMELEKRVRYGVSASLISKEVIMQELRNATHHDFKKVIASLDQEMKKYQDA